MADREPLGDLSAVPAFVRRPSAPSDVPSGTPAPGPPTRPDAQARSAAPLDPATLSMPLSRRRLAGLAGGLVALLAIVAFGHQVSDAAAASDRAAQLRTTNAALRSQLSDLQSDLAKVQDDTYVGIAARGYGLGAKREIPVVLAPGAPTLAPDAPGSASVRIGAEPTPTSPFEAWLDLLFGPARG